MATGLRAKLLKVIASRSKKNVHSLKPRCVTGKTNSGAVCSKGMKKEIVTSVGS